VSRKAFLWERRRRSRGFSEEGSLFLGRVARRSGESKRGRRGIVERTFGYVDLLREKRAYLRVGPEFFGWDVGGSLRLRRRTYIIEERNPFNESAGSGRGILH